MNRTIPVLSTAALVLGLLFGAALQPGRSADAQSAPSASPSAASTDGTFRVDPVHSSMVFRINHMGLTSFWGRFNEISGNYTFDPSNLESSRVEISVPVESVDTNNDRRDGHLRSPDYFNAKEYPTIEFRSTKIVRDEDAEDDNAYEMHGELKLHGVAKRVRTKLTWMGAKDTGRGVKSGFETTFSIKRSDFGMDSGVDSGALGDRVRIFVGIEGAQQSE